MASRECCTCGQHLQLGLNAELITVYPVLTQDLLVYGDLKNGSKERWCLF